MSGILEYIDSGRNLNTKRKTDQCIGLFKRYLSQQFVLLPPEEQDHDDLNKYLCRFLIQLKKEDGTEYEPVTIRNIVGSICRYLKDKHYANILEHPNFRDLQEAMKTKMKDLKEKGMGSGPRTASALTSEEVRGFGRAAFSLILHLWDS